LENDEMSSQSLALCIPAHNAAGYLPHLLESAVSQQIPFDEIWVYDDCSTDETSKIADKYGAKVVRGDINRGCSYGKNVLAEKTSCEWIHFHDADDLLMSNFTTLAHKWMGQPDAPDSVLFAFEYRDGETNKLYSITEFDDKALQQDPIAYTILHQINPFCGLYRRAKFLEVEGYDLDPNVLYNEDVAFHVRAARRGMTFRAEPTISIINYRYSNSMSQANLSKCIAAHVCVLEKASLESHSLYRYLIAEKLWNAAGVAGSYLAWDVADKAANLAVKLGGLNVAANNSYWFRTVAFIDAPLALRVRELLIRSFRPKLRQGGQYNPTSNH
jgi:glycosyltransferase involved in cell wall biosynthesis